jgi:hypothetical protein
LAHCAYRIAGQEHVNVECRACGRRGAIRKEDSRLQMHQGNMKELNRQKFKCRKCGGPKSEPTSRASPTTSRTP